MNDADLIRALSPVREHFKGSKVTANTVLAAYMRASGIQPTGSPWTLAKAAFDAGASFEEAVRMTQHPRRAASVDVAAPHDVATADEDARVEDPSDLASAVGISTLGWFAKVFGPGDLDGDGAKRLLGTPNISLTSVLVRETAQNSWDARLGTQAVRFSINVRRLTANQAAMLREHVLTGTPANLRLKEYLDEPEPWAIEVVDRGTRGLGGPIRNDLDVPPGTSSDFINLIFDIGAPRDVHLGAGTYGFGKTIAYQASSCGTVVFWSRTHEPRGPEDRFIASAIGPSYSASGRRHTGRHWWGVLRDGGARVEPCIGPGAARLGSEIFAQGFESDETGTSLLILDPELGTDSHTETAAHIAEAVVWHLWPKLAARDAARTPMEISVSLDGVPIELPDVSRHPILSGFVDCLELVRATQRGSQYTPQFNTEVFDLWCEKPRKLLGHLAVSRYPYRRMTTEYDPSSTAVLNGPSSHVALMRHDAELVVKYEARQRLDTDGLQWAAVFKPVPEVDDSFASAEPPAHDDWVAESITDRGQRRDVNVGLKRIKDTVTQFLAPMSSFGAPAGTPKSTAALADSLSMLVGGVAGAGPSRRRSGGAATGPGPGGGAGTGGGAGANGRGASGGARKPQTEIREFVMSDPEGDRRRVAVRIGLKSPTGVPARIRADVGIGVEGSTESENELIKVLGWTRSPAEREMAHLLSAEAPLLNSGEDAWLILDAKWNLAVDVRASAELEN